MTAGGRDGGGMLGVRRRVRNLAVKARTVLRRADFAIRRAAGRAPAQAMGRPVFIVGCGHSGTTLMLSILSAHSRLHAIPYESSFIEREPAEADWFVRRFNRATSRAAKRRWVEKTPHHIHHIAALLDRFGDARVIVMMRDGRDVACSLRARSGDFAAGVHRWLDDNAAAARFAGDTRVLFVKYEDLVSDRERQLRRVCDFLGEPFEPQLLAHHTTPFRFYGRYEHSRRFAAQIDAMQDRPPSVAGSDHRLYRSWQARQPVFDGRERWVDDLSAAEKARFKELAGDALVRYGYESDDRW